VSLATAFPRAELPPRGASSGDDGRGGDDAPLTLRQAGLTGAVSVLVLLRAPEDGA
jgi:hypothetical protein